MPKPRKPRPALLLCLMIVASSQSWGSPAAPATAGAAAPSAEPMTAARVIQVLDQTVDWYRTLGLQQQAANEPSDMLFLYDNRQTAGKVIALAFDVARANAELLAKAPAPAPEAGADAGVSAQSLAQFAAKLDAQSARVHAELDAEHRLPVPGSKQARAEREARIRELQGELDLLGTKKAMLDTLTQFAAGMGGASANSLKAQIDAMAVATVPATANGPASPAPAGAATVGSAAASSPLLAPVIAPATAGRFGLWDLGANVLKLSQKAGLVESIDRRTADLQATIAQIRAPLIDQIKALSARGDALAARADSADSAALNGVHDELDALSDRFKQTSALLLPLSRESILLDQYRRNLGNWRGAIKTQYDDALKVLGIRVGLVAAVLIALFGAAGLWRRMVLKYVQDSRRRYQLLLVRRIALWALVVFVIAVAFASELGSIVTFAGLITAGIAVAMQSVLVSIVGYFFLIGKYGIRVGDRVQIGEVAGEVIDLGLVRMYLMELGAKGTMGPTGRVVAFANSVVFQVSSGLFKQIPGVNFAWREIVLNLPPGADTARVKAELLAAVIGALKDYHPEIVRQTREIERTTLSGSAGDAQPQVQLHFAAGAVEAHVRYPVHLQHAAEIDERVTEALAHVLAGLGG